MSELDTPYWELQVTKAKEELSYCEQKLAEVAIQHSQE